jgi:hypothetical protein
MLKAVKFEIYFAQGLVSPEIYPIKRLRLEPTAGVEMEILNTRKYSLLELIC